jgi:hypothetical protein
MFTITRKDKSMRIFWARGTISGFLGTVSTPIITLFTSIIYLYKSVIWAWTLWGWSSDTGTISTMVN